MVLHVCVMVLSVSVFAGIAFLYDVPNADNQIMLLVDMSDSNNETVEKRDAIVKDILDESRSRYNIGVVLFGYDQVLASPMSTNVEDVYRRYNNAALPDTTATDIAAALNFTKGVFTKPETSKIILISDGVETDGNALSAVRAVAADGIRVDTVCINRPLTDEVEIINVTVPEYNVIVGDPFNMTITLQSTVVGAGELTLYDNQREAKIVPVYLTEGTQDIVVEYEFDAPGMHGISFEIENAQDTLLQNNTYFSYINIAVFDRILVFERNNGESDQMVSILRDGTDYTVDVINILLEKEKVPKTVDELRQYDEVMLVNIANADMPEGFDELLHTYVYTHGGGLFTVGGNDENGEANAYNKEDMEGTLYQQMLPVQSINYTPPIGVAFLIDVSRSMYEGADASGKSYVELAKEAIASCVQYSLSERDYCGIVTLGDPATEVCPLLPVPQMSRIIASMEKIEMSMSGTPYASSIEAAGTSLMSLSTVEKRHIIIVSDGEPTDEGGYDTYSKVIKRYAELGVTITIVNIGQGGYDTDMEHAAELGNGRYIKISNIQQLTDKMRNELEVDEIKEVNYETFVPKISEHTSVVSGITQDDMPELTGFYGTKIKTDATSVLVGEYVPIYAQWKYGEGSVGSFMCDLNGTWSADFIEKEAGRQILRNIAKALFPTKDIRPSEIEVNLDYGNYSTTMSVFTDLNEGERIEAFYKDNASDGNGELKSIAMSADNGYSRTTFVITQPGIHDVIVRKLDAESNVLAEKTVYRVFSYSKEYDVLSEFDGVKLMTDLAESGKGASISEAWEVFEGLEKVVHKSYDPRLAFMIAALVLFLMDIAVRKFKFKWIHELIRERKDKKSK